MDISFAALSSAALARKEAMMTTPLPTSGGRRSEAPGSANAYALAGELGLLTPELTPQWYDVLEGLAKHNADFSYAVENIVQLANTNFHIYFNDGIPDEKLDAMREHISIRSRYWYPYSAGVRGLIGDALAQAAVTGPISMEIVPYRGLTGVEQVVYVPAKTIMFRYDKKKRGYVPYQRQDDINAKSVTGHVQLNTATYRYLAHRRYSEVPYAVPPFLSALEQITIEKDMVASLKNLAKRFGVLGFVSALVNAPVKSAGETDAKYYERTKGYLDDIAPELEKSLTKGFVLGFKNTHEFTTQSVTTNASGAKELFELNDVKKMAGFKQDPLMLGRNFQTTETLARVILAKMTTQITAYQELVARLLEDIIYMELLMAGFSPKYVKIEFDEPLTGDKNQAEEAYGKSIENARELYNDGVINQTMRAQMLGFDRPDQPEPRKTEPEPGTPGSKPAGKAPTTPSNKTKPTA